MLSYIDKKWMNIALQHAFYAQNNGEVPIGAIIILNNNVIGTGYNSSVMYNDPTAHAEIIALRNAGKNIKNYRFKNATLYVTLEPCVMCCGAIINSRIGRLVFGTQYKKNNKKTLLKKIFGYYKKNIIIRSNVMEKECSQVLSSFFQERRKK